MSTLRTIMCGTSWGGCLSGGVRSYSTCCFLLGTPTFSTPKRNHFSSSRSSLSPKGGISRRNCISHTLSKRTWTTNAYRACIRNTRIKWKRKTRRRENLAKWCVDNTIYGSMCDWEREREGMKKMKEGLLILHLGSWCTWPILFFMPKHNFQRVEGDRD